MKANIALEKSITDNKYYLVINDSFYIDITEEMFFELAKFLNIEVEE